MRVNNYKTLLAVLFSAVILIAALSSVSLAGRIAVPACTNDTDCNDGLFCNGTETCDIGSGNCVAVSACPPAIDGCVTRGNFCDEVNDVCVDFADDSQCDDGLFCNGTESCDIASGNCVSVSACPPAIEGCVTRNNSCDEINDVCVDFADDSQCDDGLFCNGTESCDIASGNCVAVSACPPAIEGCVTRNNSCDEINDVCVDFADDSQCNDGLFCNGSENCDIASGSCEDDFDPCVIAESCSEVNNICVVTDPTPDIKANNSDGPVFVLIGDPFSLTAQLNAGKISGQNADWWVLANTPFPPPDDWYHYDLISGWLPGISVTYQGPLFDLPPYQVNITEELPAGAYIVYVGVDMLMNGSLDMDQIYLDSVQVIITPEN